MSELNYRLLEIRYKPNVKVLDYRGAWAEAISNAMELPELRIIENRFDVFDHEDLHHIFVSFSNAGFYVRNASTKTYFPDKAAKFLRILFEFEGFDKEPVIERIGVRSRYCRKYEGKFEDLTKKYMANFFGPSTEAVKILSADIVDIGSPITLKDNDMNINLMGGPMDAKQISQFFGIEYDIPEIGLVFDLDYWVKPSRKMTEGQITENLRSFSDSSWDMFDRLHKQIVEGK